ncbi:unnamed protein product [Cylicocyclus nassatus]|nr:unnamed protein product [Cylicocyclus nassatus]CAJ0605808.1 unnamed protein product [Cylicocyclus nassatus]
MACALKRLIIAEMNQRRKADPKYPVMFVLVCKRTLRLRIEKQYFTLEEAAARYSIPVEAIVEERNRNGNAHSSEVRSTGKRPASTDNSAEGPSAKTAKH